MSQKIQTPAPQVQKPQKGKKPLSWRKDPIILQRLAAVAEMLLRGAHVWQVASSLDCSLATAKRDVTRVRTLWREGSLAEIEDKRDESIAQYKLVQSRAWADYNKQPSPHYLRVILEAQTKIDDIQGNQQPKTHLVAELDIEAIRKKRWEDKHLMMDILSEDDETDNDQPGAETATETATESQIVTG